MQEIEISKLFHFLASMSSGPNQIPDCITGDCTRVLISGGAGFIGSHLVEVLLENGFEVVVLDDLSTGSYENLSRWKSNSRLTFLNHDIIEEVWISFSPPADYLDSVY